MFKDKRKYQYDNAIFLFYHKGFGYTIKYAALTKYYKKFLPDVEEMVKAFKIKKESNLLLE